MQKQVMNEKLCSSDRARQAGLGPVCPSGRNKWQLRDTPVLRAAWAGTQGGWGWVRDRVRVRVMGVPRVMAVAAILLATPGQPLTCYDCRGSVQLLYTTPMTRTTLNMWFSLILSDILRFSQILSDSLRFSLILSDSLRFSLNISESLWFFLVLGFFWILET